MLKVIVGLYTHIKGEMTFLIIKENDFHKCNSDNCDMAHRQITLR